MEISPHLKHIFVLSHILRYKDTTVIWMIIQNTASLSLKTCIKQTASCEINMSFQIHYSVKWSNCIMSNGKKLADSKVHWLSDKSGCQSINVHHKPWSHNNSSFNYFSCSIYRNLFSLDISRSLMAACSTI